MASQVCNQCSHVNPADASYCYYDGVRLAGGAGGPVNAGAQNFPTPFVFPSGLVARNFDQLATTSQQNWPAAVGLLKDGMFANFFSGMGRADLVQASKDAAKFPDLDRGLDQFLAKLPTNTLQDPKLKVEPTEINLGTLAYGTDRTLELRLENSGMRLLYGSVASDSKWLTLGTAPGSQQKMFQFGSELVIPLNVRGKDLRASPKPLEGQLLIESNGGTVTVTVKVSVPIVPFKDGVLAGAKSPREIAEKARPKAAEAAQYFENGAMADWFKKNGWIYPVQGPSAVGLGAVQQFFEALGLAKAPKVDISVKSLSLSGAPGEKASATIDVTTQEKKMVYAHATCEQPWVDVSKVKLAGRAAQITVNVPNIPQRPGETLQTKIHIAGNGNQRFSVPLSVTISGTPSSRPAAPAPMPAANPFAFQQGGPGAPIVKPSGKDTADAKTSPEGKKKYDDRLIHLIPLGILFLGLFIFLIKDVFWGATLGIGGLDDEPSADEIIKAPKIAVLFDWGKDLDPSTSMEEVNEGDGKEKATKAVKSLIQKMKNRNMNFGLITNTDPMKRIVFAPRGHTNNALLSIGGQYFTFGKKDTGEWVKEPEINYWKEPGVPEWMEKAGIGTWKVKDIEITQQVRIIPGEAVETKGDVFKRYYDTCEVSYRIKNTGNADQKFGMRILFDTLIGDNDGVPFTIPGESKLFTFKTFTDVPDFITCYEYDEKEAKKHDKPGVVIQLNLKHSMADRNLDPPDELRLTKWPGNAEEINVNKDYSSLEKWDVESVDPKKGGSPDSAVVMYWKAKTLEKGKTRDLGYSYSLSSSAASTAGKPAISVGGDKRVSGEVTVMALVNNAKRGETTVSLELPKGFTFAPGFKAEQPVPAPQGGRPTPVSWKIIPSEKGEFTIRVTTGEGATQAKRVRIRANNIF